MTDPPPSRVLESVSTDYFHHAGRISYTQTGCPDGPSCVTVRERHLHDT